jgi:beta-mannosidase
LPERLGGPEDLTVEIPGDVNWALHQSGRGPDPLVGLGSRDYAWVSERSWWFVRDISLPDASPRHAGYELFLAGLDVEADVFLNGHYLGHHSSMFYPFSMRVDELAVPGANTVAVRLTTGAAVAKERASRYEFPLTAAVPDESDRGYPDRAFSERVFLRKPTYVWGWDWAPHLPTCGITDHCELREIEVLEIRSAELFTEEIIGGSDKPRARLRALAEIELATLRASCYADVTFTLSYEGTEAVSNSINEHFLWSGKNIVSVELEVEDAHLWWPAGYGEQPLYTLAVNAQIVTPAELESAKEKANADYATAGGGVVSPKERPAGDEVVPTVGAAATGSCRTGIRTISLDTRAGAFGLVVNGEKLFIAGGNWVPPHHLHGCISKERLRTLVSEAAAAHLNLFRIWGGGRFERDEFFDACDEFGLLVWHDFMSACAPLPAHLPWFWDLFASEARFQIRRLRGRTCLALFCGNNEVADSYDWKPHYRAVRDPARTLYHELIPELVEAHGKGVAYWPTSPYGGVIPHDPLIGDDHHWLVMRPDPVYWSDPDYWDRADVPVFNSEYGYGGPPQEKTLREALGPAIDIREAGELGRQHINTFFETSRIHHSIAEHYGISHPSYKEFLLFGGLAQGINLAYSLESLRVNERSNGGVFWMYNDTWGEVGWAIIDFYLRRKISWFLVRRALAPVSLVFRRGGAGHGGKEGHVYLIGLNNTERPVGITTLAGYLSFTAREDRTRLIEATLRPRSRTVVAEFPELTDQERTAGTLMQLPAGRTTAAQQPEIAVRHLARPEASAFYHARHRQWLGDKPQIRTFAPGTDEALSVLFSNEGDHTLLTLTARRFLHAVWIDIDPDTPVSDNFFDLLPGEKRTVVMGNGSPTLNATPPIHWVDAASS